MTTISPGSIPPLPGAASLAGGSPTTALPAGASFADTLLTLLDRALVETPGQPDDRFAAGTMRSSVEMFDERGFFEDRAPTDQHQPESPLASDSTAPPGVPPPAFPPAETLSVLQSDPTHVPVIAPPPGPPPVAVTTPALASDLAVDGQIAIAGSTPVVPFQPGTAARAMVSGAPLPSSPAPRLRAAGMIVEDPTPQERPPRAALRRDPPALAASRVKVTLDHVDNGVAVSVVADVEPDTDTDAGSMHEAVSRMLARHGLTLSELRVTRRPGAAGQDRKD